MSDCLSEDVIVQILARLPVKSLMRFKCVSKGWRSLISNPQLAKAHFQFASTQQTLTHGLLFFITTQQPLESLVLESPSFGDRSSARKLALPSPPSKETKDLDLLLLGSCNGLVFACFSKQSYCIWNPTTGFFQGLPDPEFAHPEDVHFLHHGIGYVSETDEYKVILSVDFFSAQEVRIFSLRDQIWKVMESPCGFVIEGQGVPLHETLHWVYREGEEFNDQNESFAVIIAFDLTTEEFWEMPLPVAWLQEEDSWVALFSCRGCLCLWKYGMRAASASASVECWVMETYGVTDSWTRGPNFSISNPPELIRFLRPLLVTETSRVLLRNSADGELELVKIDDQEEEIVTYMHGWNHGWFAGGTHMIVYEETLLSCQVVEPIQPGIRVKKNSKRSTKASQSSNDDSYCWNAFHLSTLAQK